MAHDASLEPVLRAVEPAARLVPERYLRHVAHFLSDTGHPVPTNPDLPLWVSRQALAAADVLPPRAMAGTEPDLLLVTDPDDRMIERLPRGEQLRVYWRVLYRAAVMRAVDLAWEAGVLAPAECRDRLLALGPTAAREVRAVLEAEHLVVPGADDAAVFRAFAAVYLDLRAFDRHAAEDYFPSLPHGPGVAQSLAEVVDAAGLLAQSRPAGADDPPADPEPHEQWPETAAAPAPPAVAPADPGGLLAKARDAEGKGNHVRAAILRAQLAAAGGRGLAETGALAALDKVVDELGRLLGWDGPTRREWRQALAPLLGPAAAGVWPRAARGLYELQKLPADLGREVFAVDLPEAIRTLGRRPVKRPLPRARRVLLLMGLKRAQAQLLRAGLPAPAHLRLDRLFHHETHRAEGEIRAELTPVVAAALAAAGLVPTTTVEEVGRDKLVAELLDRVCDRGYLRFGDLRDAVARNRLKLPDLRGPGELLRGDPLLRADDHLSEALDGVYRRGEFYLRWLQRGSSVFFAGPVGRALFLYLLLPFAGAFMTVVFAIEMAHIGSDAYAFVAKRATKKPPPAPDPARAAAADGVEYDEETNTIWWSHDEAADLAKQVFTSKPGGFHVPWGWVGGLAVFLFLVLHVPPFRRAVGEAFRYAWLLVRGVVWDLPVGVWRSGLVRRLRLSRPARLLGRHFATPLLLTALVFGLMVLFGVSPRFLLRWGWAVWAGLTVAYNTPWGWVAQDRLAEMLSDWWRVVRVNLIPGLIATVVDWCRALANWVERRLYAVDERLRFRGGDSGGSLAVKAVLGLLWFPVAYLTRFAFYLLLEPQINPVKHFPVVTVSHKLLLPLVVVGDPANELSSFGGVVASVTGWGVAKANVWAFTIVACVPGVFGFIAWELLANWRLYRANRSPRLNPVTIGSHGESMRGLLRPGFHSGTVPRLFRKLRRAGPAKAGRLHHDLAHAAEGVHRFVDRELVDLLDRTPGWGGVRVAVGAVRFGCQRAVVELTAPALGGDAFALSFENVGGRIAAAVEQAGWADKLTGPQAEVFVAALRGLLDMAAAERVDGRERSADAAGGPGFADLARTVGSDEWAGRWGAAGA
ncbi:MAG: hypothetical protein C0501_13875 [Isosphaera sp.]|nr:hypothetical protein [Isosphaera sp.]